MLASSKHLFWKRSSSLGLRLGLLVLLLLPLGLIAQEQQSRDSRVRLIVELEPNSILVGEQSLLKVKLVYPRGAQLALQLPADTVVRGVELLAKPLLTDSATVSDDICSKTWTVPITAFDSASYKIDNVAALVDGVLYPMNEHPILSVGTPEVDLSHPEQYYGLKDNWTPPFVWQDYLLYAYVLLGALLLAAIIYIIVKHLKRRTTATQQQELPDPYQEAVHAFKDIRQKEWWQKGAAKHHYTALTDTVRLYLHRKLAISTMDKTSDEILSAVQLRKEVSKKELRELRELLYEADLVKFAKYSPTEAKQLGALTTSEELVNEIEASVTRYKEEQERLQAEVQRKNEPQNSNVL